MRLPPLLALAILSVTAHGRPVEVAELDRPPDRFAYEPAAAPADIDSPRDVTLVAIISTTGRVERIESLDAPDQASGEAASRAVRRWAFAPPFSGGRPAQFRLPITVPIRPGQTYDREADESVSVGQGTVINGVEVAYQSIPAYPAGLEGDPVDGYAIVNLLIDEQGRPHDPVVEFATRPEFGPPAVTAVLDWAFSPALRGRAPFAARTTLSVPFPAASAGWTPEERDLRARLAYARSYDVAPQERTTVPIVFPYDALVADRRGGVMVSVVVGPDGRVSQINPDRGADPEFAAAVRASLTSWTFAPATKAGRAVYGLVAMQITFDPRGDEFEHDATTFALLDALRAGTAEILSLKQVDTHPKPVRQTQPVMPVGSTGEAVGEALIECIIDTSGRPQLPRIVRATSPDLGWSAATAVAQWRFHPATKDGKPVACRARLPLRFAAPEPPATP